MVVVECGLPGAALLVMLDLAGVGEPSVRSINPGPGITICSGSLGCQEVRGGFVVAGCSLWMWLILIVFHLKTQCWREGKR